jgi:phage terminase large subunit
MSPEDQEVIAKAIKRWRKGGPALFAKEALGVSPTTQQIEGSTLLVEKRRLTIRSGHGTGKSSFLSWTILWGLICHAPCKIPCTAPTAHQLRDILWAEVAQWHRVLKERVPYIASQIDVTGDEVRLKDMPQEAFAVARTARPEAPEALQGFHAPTIIFLLDEASGIADQVYEVAEGALSTRGAYVIQVGNPTRMSGAFYDSHHKDRAEWACLHWSGEESTLVSPEYIERMRRRYGSDSSIYKIRVKGEFAGNPDGVIPLQWALDAVGRDVRQTGEILWGVDVARFGEDRTVLARRHGNTMPTPPQEWAGLDTMEVAGRILHAWNQAATADKPVTIFVDSIGIGAGVVDRLKEMGLPVRGVNVSESPASKEDYNKLRDELWFRGRHWFEGRDVRLCEGCDDLLSELSLPEYKILPSGKQKVDSKDELRRKGVVHSPDQADAFLLTFADGRAKTPYKAPATDNTLGGFGWMA